MSVSIGFLRRFRVKDAVFIKSINTNTTISVSSAKYFCSSTPSSNSTSTTTAVPKQRKIHNATTGSQWKQYLTGAILFSFVGFVYSTAIGKVKKVNN